MYGSTVKKLPSMADSFFIDHYRHAYELPS